MTAGNIKMRVLIEGGSYMRKYSTQRKLLYFVNGHGVESSKIGHYFRRKILPKTRKIWIIFDGENWFGTIHLGRQHVLGRGGRVSPCAYSVDSIKHTVLLKVLWQIFLLVSIKNTVHWKFSRQINLSTVSIKNTVFNSVQCTLVCILT